MSEPQENFPVEALRHLENKIKIMRQLLMDTASDLARKDAGPEAKFLTFLQNTLTERLVRLSMEQGTTHVQ
jgi:hypothetical protein